MSDPGGWAATEPVIRCYRCGEVAQVKWIYTTTMADPTPVRRYASGQCVTPGCEEPSGSNDPRQPTPAQLRKRADQAWFDRQRELVEDR